MELNVNERSGIHFVEPIGRMMGGPETVHFRQTIKDLVASNHRRFLVNLSGIEWLNSSGLGALICSYATVTKVGGCIAFTGTDRVKQLLEMTCLEEVLDVYDSVDEAVAALLAEDFN